jgi:hypothetical protein
MDFTQTWCEIIVFIKLTHGSVKWRAFLKMINIGVHICKKLTKFTALWSVTPCSMVERDAPIFRV